MPYEALNFDKNILHEPGMALLISRKGKILIKNGQGLANLQTQKPITPATNFRLASVSKQFTAMSILLLVSQQKLSLQDTLNNFFNYLPSFLQNITIHQLLTHSSGIPDYESLVPSDQKKSLSDENVFQLIKKQNGTYFPPGSTFRYSNTGYCLLALIVQKTSGSSFPDFIEKNIFQPLQMNHSLVYQQGKEITSRAYGYHLLNNQFHLADQNITSATMGDGGIYTSLTDYMKWYQALINHTLISKDFTEMMFAPHRAVKDGISYGYGWFMGKEKDGTTGLFHSGESTGFHNIVYLNRDKELLTVLFSNRDDKLITEAFDAIEKFIGIAIAFAVKNSSPSTQRSLFQWLSHVYMNVII